MQIGHKNKQVHIRSLAMISARKVIDLLSVKWGPASFSWTSWKAEGIVFIIGACDLRVSHVCGSLDVSQSKC